MKNELIKTLIFATKTEAAPFINGLNLQKKTSLPFSVYNKKSLFIIISGIGKIKAALAVAYAVLNLKTDLTVNFGACGALDDKFERGEILSIEKIIDNASGIITYPAVLAKHKTASLLTTDRPIITKKKREKLAVYAPLVDMEGAGFMEACNLYKTRGYLFKIISDNNTDNSRQTIIEKITIAGNLLYNHVIEKKILTDANFRIMN